MRISDWSSDVCSSDLTNRCCTGSCARPLWELHTSLHARWETISSNTKKNVYRPEQFGYRGKGQIFLVSPSKKACGRSEEHTSELQSLMRISYAVFCLQKKTTHIYNTSNQQ